MRSRNIVAGLFVALVVVFATSVSAMAVTTGTDLPTTSSAYNAGWQSAPSGYITPRQDGFGAPGKIGHVWVIVLENHAYDSSFTPLEGTQNTYLENLPSQGALLTNYYGTGHSSLDNYTSMVSGQAPISDDQDDCPSYTNINGTIDKSGTPATNSDYGQLASSAGADAPPYDNGCVYPSSVDTIFNQLDSAQKSWKVYAQDLGNPDAVTPTHDASTASCGAPDATVGTAPTSSTAGTFEANPSSANATDQYVAKHNPLPWFQSVLGSGDCAKDLASNGVDSSHVAALFGADDALFSDLHKVSTTPDFSYIVPNNCSNGHDAVCAGNNLSGEGAGFPTYNTSSTIPAETNATGGTLSESAFLGVVVPEIEASPAFKQNGLIVVTYDEAYPPFTYSSDSQANSTLEPADAANSLQNDAAGETLYGRSLNWEPTGPNATLVTASDNGQVLSAGPGDSAYLDRPTAVDGSLVACKEPSLTEAANTDTWIPFTAPTSSNGACVPGFQANTERPAGTTKSTGSVTIAANSSTVPYTAATDALSGMSVTFGGTAPTLYDTGTSTTYTGAVYVGDVADTAQNPAVGGAAFTGQFSLVDANGNPVEVSSAGYTGTLTLTAIDNETDPFFDAFDATMGGGDAGAVLISPYIAPGTVSNTDYNHYSLLRSLEDIYGISSYADQACSGKSYWSVSNSHAAECGVGGTGYLGFASQPGLAPFGKDIFTDVSDQHVPWRPFGGFGHRGPRRGGRNSHKGGR